MGATRQLDFCNWLVDSTYLKIYIYINTFVCMCVLASVILFWDPRFTSSNPAEINDIFFSQDEKDWSQIYWEGL